MQVLIFSLKDRYYAVETKHVVEMIRSEDLTENIYSVPKAANWVKGLINLQGEVITLVNMAKLLNLKDDMCYNNTIIMQNDTDKIGFKVENIVGVKDINREDLKSSDVDYIIGSIDIIEGKEETVDIIDVSMLISENEG